MIKGFKEFISQGNVIDLAVAVIIGAAFNPIVKAVTDVIMAMIAGVVGKPDFSGVLAFSIGDSVIKPGTIITETINFFIIAFAVYFFIVVPMNKIKALKKTADDEAAAEAAAQPSEAELLVQIRDLLAAK